MWFTVTKQLFVANRIMFLTATTRISIINQISLTIILNNTYSPQINVVYCSRTLIDSQLNETLKYDNGIIDYNLGSSNLNNRQQWLSL